MFSHYPSFIIPSPPYPSILLLPSPSVSPQSLHLFMHFLSLSFLPFFIFFFSEGRREEEWRVTMATASCAASYLYAGLTEKEKRDERTGCHGNKLNKSGVVFFFLFFFPHLFFPTNPTKKRPKYERVFSICHCCPKSIENKKSMSRGDSLPITKGRTGFIFNQSHVAKTACCCETTQEMCSSANENSPQQIHCH